MGRLKLFLYLLPLLVSSTSQQAAAAPPPEAAVNTHVDVVADLERLTDSTFRFWRQYGLDKDRGGFHGTLDTAGTPIQPWEKGLVQTARHAWTFSYYHKLGGTNTDSPSAATMAQSAYSFLMEKLLDRTTGLFYWTVSQDGAQVVSSAKVLYGQWFAIYAAAMYGDAFSSSDAKSKAMECFTAVDRAWHNSSTGGYNHLLSNSIDDAGESNLVFDVSSNPHAVISELNPGSTQPDKILPTTLNDVLHGIEALSMLYKVKPEGQVKDRLLELLRIFCVQMPTSDGVIYGEYIPGPPSQPWKPADNTILDYGHMIEGSWLVSESVEDLLAVGAISPSLASQYQDAMFTLGAKAVEYGYDKTHGGFFATGMPGKYPTSDAKIWWTQAEGCVGLWNLYLRSGKNHMYYEMLVDTLDFIEKYLVDPKYGEMYWQVESNGVNNPESSPHPGIKGNKWKASYHNLRMLLLLPRRIKSGV
jgi:mannose/cellobiose epimerase-like protein (N-acyl-D-glucosamine 2-epimerase family)